MLVLIQCRRSSHLRWPWSGRADCYRERRLSPLLNAHSLASSLIKRTISFGLNLHGPGYDVLRSPFGFSENIASRGRASAMMCSRSACARALTSAAIRSVFAAAKVYAVDRSSIRFAVQPHLVCGALLPRRTTTALMSSPAPYGDCRWSGVRWGGAAGAPDTPRPVGGWEQGLNRLAASIQLCMPDS